MMTNDLLFQVASLLCLMDIAAEMSYLHSLGLLHSDLKGANVLLSSCPPIASDPRGFMCKVCVFMHACC
jgi:serine/threonine protein kinase